MLPGEESVLSSKEYGVLLEIGERLLGFALAMTGKGQVRLKEGELGFVAVILGLYTKAVKTFRAIHLLCVHGLCEDAQALLRTLSEILADIKYLAGEDKEDRARQYMDFIVIQDHKLIQATERNPGLRGMFPDETKALVQQRLASARGRMAEEEFEKRYKAGAWHGRKIEQVMCDVGMQTAYDLPFRQGSRAVHATDLFDHIVWKPAQGFTLNLLPGDRWAKPVLRASSLFFLEILDQVNTIGNFREDQGVQALRKDVVAQLQDN